MQVCILIFTVVVMWTNVHWGIDYVTGGESTAVSFGSTKLDSRIIASMRLQETRSFTETNNRADDGAAVYSMSPVSKSSLTAH